MEPRLSGQRAGSHWLWPGESMPFGVNARAGGRLTLSFCPFSDVNIVSTFFELLILPTGWRERTSTWLPAESLLITGPRTCSSVPHRGGCPDAYPCHAGLHQGSCDPGALTSGPPIAGTHRCPSAVLRISHEEFCGSVFILPQDIPSEPSGGRESTPPSL